MPFIHRLLFSCDLQRQRTGKGCASPRKRSYDMGYRDALEGARSLEKGLLIAGEQRRAYQKGFEAGRKRLRRLVLARLDQSRDPLPRGTAPPPRSFSPQDEAPGAQSEVPAIQGIQPFGATRVGAPSGKGQTGTPSSEPSAPSARGSRSGWA